MTRSWPTGETRRPIRPLPPKGTECERRGPTESSNHFTTITYKPPSGTFSGPSVPNSRAFPARPSPSRPRHLPATRSPLAVAHGAHRGRAVAFLREPSSGRPIPRPPRAAPPPPLRGGLPEDCTSAPGPLPPPQNRLSGRILVSAVYAVVRESEIDGVHCRGHPGFLLEVPDYTAPNDVYYRCDGDGEGSESVPFRHPPAV